MTRRERIYKTLRGEQTDRPPVNFYEINGLDENPSDPDPYNIYNHASWKPLLELAREKTDRLVMRGATFVPRDRDPLFDRTTVTTREEGASRVVTRTIRLPGRTLTSQSRRDAAVNTWWTTEHLLKDPDDLKAFLEVPPQSPIGSVSVESVIKTETALGDTGAVMLDTADPLCLAASLFDMGTYTGGVDRAGIVPAVIGSLRELDFAGDGGGRGSPARPTLADLRTRICRAALFAARLI